MNKKMLLLACLFGWVLQALAGIKVSTTQPGVGKPEHLYTMVSGNNIYANGMTGTTKPSRSTDNLRFMKPARLGSILFIAIQLKNGFLILKQVAIAKVLPTL